MNLRTQLTAAWRSLTSAPIATRKTAALPAIFTPYSPARANTNATPKPTPANLRRFAETPIARRAINVVKDKIASMDWQIRIRRGYSPAGVPNAAARMQALRQGLEEPNASDSFRTLIEQTLEDLLVGGFGAIEMEATGDERTPLPALGRRRRHHRDRRHLERRPRHAPLRPVPRRPGHAKADPPARRRAHLPPPQPAHPHSLRPRPPRSRLRNRQPIPLPPTATPAGSPPTPSCSTRSGSTKPRLSSTTASSAGGRTRSRAPAASPSCSAANKSPKSCASPAAPTPTSACSGSNSSSPSSPTRSSSRPCCSACSPTSTAPPPPNSPTKPSRSAVIPVAKLFAEHITRDLFAKKLGWREFEFVFNDLEARDEMEELQIQTQLLQAGVLTIAEVREMRGLPPLTPAV